MEEKHVLTNQSESTWNKKIIKKYGNDDGVSEAIHKAIVLIFTNRQFKEAYIYCDNDEQYYALVILLSLVLPEVKQSKTGYIDKSKYLYLNCEDLDNTYFEIFRFAEYGPNQQATVEERAIMFQEVMSNIESNVDNIITKKIMKSCFKLGKQLSKQYPVGDRGVTIYVFSCEDASKYEKFLKKVMPSNRNIFIFNQLRICNFQLTGPVRLGMGENSFGYYFSIGAHYSKLNGKPKVNSFKQFRQTDLYKYLIIKKRKSIKEMLEDFKVNTTGSFKSLSDTVNKNLTDIRNDNNEKLDKINQSVNEKLQKTLEEKLKDSFKSVIEGIGDVNKAVGEIKGLANDVGSLKNVLTNVKNKGILGEVMLGNIIQDFLTVGQYDENVVTKKGSSERVEFAIKLPGQKDSAIYLPVDSKFPYESYSIIHESTNINEISEAKKKMKADLLKYAKDVSDKYIDVPNTTDFAVIFLPLEGLFLEALNMGLFEEIQSKYKVNLTGPTTFTAFISSLNMGFKSLRIQKKSADVFKLLGAVKTEFGKFAVALEKTQDKVNSAANELDTLVGTRTRMMNSKLKSIETLDSETAALLIEGTESE